MSTLGYKDPLVGALQSKYWKCGCSPQVRGVSTEGGETLYTPVHSATCPTYGSKKAQKEFEKNVRRERRLLKVAGVLKA